MWLAMTVVPVLTLLTTAVFQVHCHSPHTAHLKRSDDLTGSLEAVVSTQAQRLQTLEAELQALKNVVSAHNASPGSSFVRWGRSSCPSRATLVYSGYAAGSHNSDPGGGANRLCVTQTPVYDDTALDTYYGRLDGMEFSLSGHHYTDVVCAVCLASQRVTFMLPGTNRCPSGSVTQYKGHLTAGDHNAPTPSEYLCLDQQPEDRAGSQATQDSGYFEHVRSHCGALPCPPYVENKVVTCAVCSM
ncbi:hypothetical protein ACOMHN_007504 [Nucella lapillus]